MPESIWGEYSSPLAAVLPITQTSMRLDLPAGRYLADFPVVLVTVSGAPTEVTIASPKEFVAGYGEVHNHVQLTFPSALVGKTLHLLVLGR